YIGAPQHRLNSSTVGALAMARSNGGKAKAFFRANPSGAFDQYLQDIQKLPLIKDPAEERRLARRVQRGDEKAAERLVTANLRFVISYVKKYQGHGLDLSELVAIGNEGLLKAVKKFDPDQGVKFISYAVWWVRQAVLKALAEQTGGEIEKRTDGKLMREFIDRIFQKYLTPRERKILYLYYGLEEGSEAMTLEKIGALMGVTRERIRQIRERAFEKLRESPDGKALKGFWRAAYA